MGPSIVSPRAEVYVYKQKDRISVINNLSQERIHATESLLDLLEKIFLCWEGRVVSSRRDRFTNDLCTTSEISICAKNGEVGTGQRSFVV